MKLLKKAAATLLVCTMMFSCAQLPLSVSALSIEDAIQCGLKLANDDSHGYSQANRWGPDYDCSSFVLTCLQQAGFSTGNAYTTHSMKAELTRLGFKWYPWNTLNGVPDLKRGDILLDEDYHTEFYIGAGMDLGAFNDTSHPESGDQTGREICTLPYFSYNWDGVLRYTNDIPNVKPSDVSISTYSDYCAVGNNVHFSIFSINAAEQHITFWKNGKKAFDLDVTDKYEYDYQFTESGAYTYVLTAKNHLGETKTQEQQIRVYESAPQNVTLSADRKVIPVNESVKFSFSSTDSTRQTLYIDDGSWWGNDIDVTDKNQYTHKFEEAGINYVTLYAYNPIGGQQSERVRIDVYNSKPENVGVYSDKSNYAAGDTVVLTPYSSYAETLTLSVSVNGKLSQTVDITGKTEYPLKVDKGGDYECVVTAKNSFGETVSSPSSFKVYDSAPTDVRILTSNSSYPLMYSVDLEYESQNAVSANVIITDESGTVCDERELGASDWYWYTFPHAGEYTFKVTAVNPYGERSAEKKLTIYETAPSDVSVTADKTLYALGDEINFNISAKNASYTRLIIKESDSYYDDTYTVTNQSSYSKESNRAGTFTYRIEAQNDYGEMTSEEKTYTVFDSEPYNVTVTTDKSAYALDETITFTTDGTYAFERILNISANGEEPIAVDLGSDTEYKTSFDVQGDYTYTLTARNSFGECISEEGKFVVYYGRPEKLEIVSDKSEYVAGEKAVFTFSSAYAVDRYLNIYLDNDMIEKIDVSDVQEYTYVLADAGVYEYSLTAVNPKGSANSESHSFKAKKGYTVAFDANGGSGTPEPQTKTFGSYIYLNNDTPVREGYVFEGWSTKKDSPAAQYYSGSTYSADKDVVFYAVWRSADDYSYSNFDLKEWKWNDDGTVQVLFADQNYEPENVETGDTPESSHSVLFDADVTSDVYNEPDCFNEGRLVRRASVLFRGWEYTDSKEEMIPALGHDYRLTRWKWTEGNKAEPYFVCARDGHTADIPEAAVTRETIPEEFKVVYTAAAEFDGKTYTTKRTVDGYAIGDINNDRAFTSDDALEVLRLSSGLGNEKTKEALCDADGDGSVTSGDALEILRYSTGLSVTGKIGEILDFTK